MRIVLGVVLGLILCWVVLVVALWRLRPRTGITAEALRLLPDVVRLTQRLARDRSLPRGLRVRLWLLLAYLASPIDLVPDFIPVIGYADDAVIVAVALRTVVRRAGRDVVAGHWPGTSDGLRIIEKFAGLT